MPSFSLVHNLNINNIKTLKVLRIGTEFALYKDRANLKEREDMIDRVEVSRALAKAIAFKNVGKDQEAETWARQLIKLLELANILKD